MWIFDVAMNTWMRGRSAWRTASHARSTSLKPVRDKPRDDRAAHGLGDRLDRLEVAVGRDREAGLDDVDPEAGELLGDLQLLGDVERDAGRLLAVSQCRVEDLDRVHVACLRAVGVLLPTKNPPARGTEGEREHLCGLALM